VQACLEDDTLCIEPLQKWPRTGSHR
jgi:hypothetical protein